MRDDCQIVILCVRLPNLLRCQVVASHFLDRWQRLIQPVAALISVRKVWLGVAECRRVFIHCVIASGFAVVVVRRSGCAARSAPSVDAWSARSCDADRAGVFYS